MMEKQNVRHTVATDWDDRYRAILHDDKIAIRHLRDKAATKAA